MMESNSIIHDDFFGEIIKIAESLECNKKRNG